MATDERFGVLLALLRRQQGWSQGRLAELLNGASGRTALTRHEISRWENERDGRLPSIYWLRHLAVVLGVDLRLLERGIAASRGVHGRFAFPAQGISDDDATPDHADLLTRFAAGRSVGSETARLFGEQLDEIRALDRKHGAPATHDRLLKLTESMQSLLSFAVSPAGRAPLARTVADAAALAGWQALDLGDLERAWQLHETSKAAAREAESIASLAHSMAEQSCVLLDLGCYTDAIELVQAARDTAAGRVPRILNAWLLATEAEAWAAMGKTNEARRHIDQAAETLPPKPDAHLPYIFLEPAHMARWRGNILARIGDHDATTDLFTALGDLDNSFVRASAGLECDIAIALIAQGECDEAQRHAARAQHLAQQTGSVRQRKRTQRLSRPLK